LTGSPVSKKMKLLLQELLRDSSRSDRELAKALGTSQPTLSRIRRNLIEDKTVKNYTVIPDFYKMGYRLLAITLVKSKFNLGSLEQRELSDTRARNWMMKKPNIVFCDRCRGLGMDGIMISPQILQRIQPIHD
jgi:DNA-binding Lrp family transcriptional regulator